MDELIGPNVQIVLSVIEGQGFGFIQNPIYVSANLNGHILESDSVGPCSCPDFGTNLIWQADKKGLRVMRTGNIPMKVECFTINSNDQRDRIGYILLSLRSMQIIPTGKNVNPKQVWQKLMGLKNEVKSYHPELLLSFHVEDDNTKAESEEHYPDNMTQVLPSKNSGLNTDKRSPIVPRLCSEEGLIQIGPEKTCSDIFLLSILIGTASNLDLLLTDTKREVNSYSFWYSIFGHSIQTKPFYRNLHEPCILNEKIVLRLRSSLKMLKIYFTEVSLLNLKLLCECDEIGFADTDLNNLVPTEKLCEFFAKYAIDNAVTQTSRCYLYSSKSGQTPSDELGHKPCINMEIKLKYLPSLTTEKVKSQEYNNIGSTHVTARSTTDLKESENVKEDMKLRSVSLTGLEPNAVSCCYQEPTPRIYNESGGDYILNLNESSLFKNISPKSFKNQTHSLSTGDVHGKIAEKSVHVTQSNDTALKQGVSLPLSVCDLNSERTSILEAYHRFGLNVSMESVIFYNNLNKRVQFRFHHPKAEIIYCSHPVIDIKNINETICLQNIKSRVNFVSTHDEIGRLLLAWPPKISLCEATDSELPILLGESSLDTSLLFKQDSICHCELKLYEPVTKNIIALVQVAMFIEDCGVKIKKDPNSEFLGPPILDERIAYKLIEELEDWKEKQQEMFKVELARKEENRLKLLSNEWHAKRMELETKLSNGIEKCRQLASNLTKATDDQRLKSAKHLEAETKYKRLKEDLEMKYGLRSQDLRETTRRIEDEYNHKLNLIKNENSDLIERIAALERENALLKDTIKRHETELNDLRSSSLTKEQTASLIQELKSVEEKLESSIKSKAFFKEEWGKTVREIHRLKSEHQKQLQTQIRLKKEELSSLGLKKFLVEDEAQMRSDHYVLSKIKGELNQLQLNEQKTSSNFENEEYNSNNIYTTSRPDLLDMSSEEKAAMLLEERDALLRTGSYTEHDPVIIKLNLELQNVLHKQNLQK